jgi:hypothetical protein
MGDPIRGPLVITTWAVKETTFRLLSDCEYWKRLWVVQEMGKAASLEVCYTTISGAGLEHRSLPWAKFISKVQCLAKRSTQPGALRLDGQSQKQESGIAHAAVPPRSPHEALCKNPRDKIYGLAGLTEDCYGLPINYGKSLFEVWTDTLNFLQESGQVQDDLPGLAGIMMNALGGPSQVMPPPGIRTSVKLELRILLVGIVANIGPTCDDIIGKLGVGDDWAASIHRSDNTCCSTTKTSSGNY